MLTIFKNAQEAFEQLYNSIDVLGEDRGNGTRRIKHVGFIISNPLDNHIHTPYRKWNPQYAEREFQWYLSQDRSVEELAKFAPIWNRMHGGDFIVNSNYGYQWNRENQLEKAIHQLKSNCKSRQAWVTIMDGKEKDIQNFDTPCTLAIGFEINNQGKLCMEVLMRSNDLWFGFCNDQYCFSKLQEVVAKTLDREVGSYYHYSADMHIYNDQLNKNIFNKSLKLF